MNGLTPAQASNFMGLNLYNPGSQDLLIKKLLAALQDTGYQSLDQALRALLQGGGSGGSGLGGAGFGSNGSGGSTTGGGSTSTDVTIPGNFLARPVGGSSYISSPTTAGASV